MAQTKTQRRAAGKKAAKTRLLNEAQKMADPHSVDHAETRTTEQEVHQSYGVDRSAHDEPWSVPAELDAPEPRAGFTQRWIRIRVGNDDDAKNSMRKFREGWLPRQVDTVPEGYAPPTFLHSRLGNVIGVEDLILCEMPVKKAAQRNAYYQQKIDRMVTGIENDLRNVSRGGPRIDHDHQTRVTKRRLRVPTDPTE